MRPVCTHCPLSCAVAPACVRSILLQSRSDVAGLEGSWESAAALNSKVLCLQATSVAGWDVVSPEECLLSNATWRLLTSTARGHPTLGARFAIRAGQILQHRDKPCRQFFVLLEVRSLRPPAAQVKFVLKQPASPLDL